jgi:hypothetical protein
MPTEEKVRQMTDLTGLSYVIFGPGNHRAYYPAHLEDAAIRMETDLAFYAVCSEGCGTGAIAIAWVGDRVRVMQTGGMKLADRLDATGWPELNLGGADGPFMCRVVPTLGWAEFAQGQRADA